MNNYEIIKLIGKGAFGEVYKGMNLKKQNLVAIKRIKKTDGNFMNEIKICQGDAVNFVGSGIYNQNGTNYTQTDATSTFEWDFGDGTTAAGTKKRSKTLR